MLPKLKCPGCGWLYGPEDYPAALSPREYVPHHQFGGFPGWCPGTEQTPRDASDTRPPWKDMAPATTPKEPPDVSKV